MTPQFPKVPHGWYYACSARRLSRGGPVGVELGGRNFVAFRDANGRACVLDARCSHMGANLACGRVERGQIHCPLHDWRYDGAGRCVRIPASDHIPPFARQTVYPSQELGGMVVFCNTPAPTPPPFPMPFYDNVAPDDLLAAAPFNF